MTALASATPETLLEQRFQFTGSLLETSVYLPRPADDDLEELLFSGAYCNIIAPRQIGKTSLRVRVATRLEARGRRCVALDLTSLGTVRKDEEWYFGFIYAIARSLGQPSPWAFWKELAGVPFARRWSDYLLSLAEQFPQGLVIFVDEIEAVLLSDSSTAAKSPGAPEGDERFSRDDFFTAIRALFEGRNQDERCRRLTFCLVGVTTPSDLVVNKKVTPFNISRSVLLQDFTRAEIDALAKPLAALGANPQALLDAIFAWTDGHPYMTMRICACLARAEQVPAGQERSRVDGIVQREFLDHALEDPNLNYAARRFDDTRFETGGVTLTDKILLYDRVLSNQFVEDQVEDHVQLELRLAGMIKVVYTAQGRGLRVRNRIYAEALDREWLASKGDRREIATGVWAWIKADRNSERLFRGSTLREALERARSGVPLSPIEREFLTESQRFETEGLQRAEAQARDAAELKQRETEELAQKEQRLRGRVRTLAWAVAGTVVAGGAAVYVLYLRADEAAVQLEAATVAQRRAVEATKLAVAAQAAAEAAKRSAEVAKNEAQVATNKAQEDATIARAATDLALREADQARNQAAQTTRSTERRVVNYTNTSQRYSDAAADQVAEDYGRQITTLKQRNTQLADDLKSMSTRLETCERGAPSCQSASTSNP